MQYTLKGKTHNVIKVFTMEDKFSLLPYDFKYSKTYPSKIHNQDFLYKRMIDIDFRWFFWRIEILLRKP
jgi:hypothetical protein